MAKKIKTGTPLANTAWENFCVALVSNGRKRKAAEAAGYPSKSASCQASKLMKQPEILARIAELQGVVAKVSLKPIMDVGERKEKLSEIARETLETKFGITRDGNLRAISELNRMEHIYETGVNLNFNDVKFVIGKGYANKQLPEPEGDIVDGISDQTP